jgi:hypothetical protein
MHIDVRADRQTPTGATSRASCSLTGRRGVPHTTMFQEEVQRVRDIDVSSPVRQRSALSGTSLGRAAFAPNFLG